MFRRSRLGGELAHLEQVEAERFDLGVLALGTISMLAGLVLLVVPYACPHRASRCS